LDAVRKLNTSATESRVEAQKANQALKNLEEKFAKLQHDLNEKNEIISSLEFDLVATCSHPSGKGLPTADDEAGKFPQTPVGLGKNNSYTTGKHLRMKSTDLAEFPHTVGSSEGPSDRSMVQAIQNQRDRFMKSVQDKDQELSQYRIRFERSQEELFHVRDENVELYRRIRLLKSAASVQGSATGGLGTSDESRALMQTRIRKERLLSSSLDNSLEAGQVDHIDAKYSKLYEDTIDPFKMEELDKQSILAKLNIFEKGLASISRIFLRDRWTRHVLLVYLLLLHCFAIAYVGNVLNPQLVEEVDSNLRAKWSSATLDYAMNREHPDTE
jgi:hypothetical protein